MRGSIKGSWALSRRDLAPDVSVSCFFHCCLCRDAMQCYKWEFLHGRDDGLLRSCSSRGLSLNSADTDANRVEECAKRAMGPRKILCP